jgi:hypothetical protein
MTVKLRITDQLLRAILADLRRPHEFALERVGFVYCKQSALTSGVLLMASHYEPIRDDQYIPDDTVGARFDSAAIRTAMQHVLTDGFAALHVHLHEHTGTPTFSRTDKREMQNLMPCFVNVGPDRLHGALVLSGDSAVCNVWGADLSHPMPVTITLIGPRIIFLRQPQ